MPWARLLQRSSVQSMAAPPSPIILDSDVVVILSALLCALICVVGLALVARCAWMRRYAATVMAPPSKGIKKKVLNSLPRQPYVGGGRMFECPICLAEFVDGDEIRILPQCGHEFHVGCVDRWLVSHSSCPSCRRVLVVAAAGSSRCQQCGAAAEEFLP